MFNYETYLLVSFDSLHCNCPWVNAIWLNGQSVDCGSGNKLVSSGNKQLTHWGQVTHTCVSELTIIGSDNGLSPGLRQAIIWNYARLLLIEPLRTNISEISIGIQALSFKKMHLNMSSAKWRLFCLGLNVLTGHYRARWRLWRNHGSVSWTFFSIMLEWLL